MGVWPHWLFECVRACWAPKSVAVNAPGHLPCIPLLRWAHTRPSLHSSECVDTACGNAVSLHRVLRVPCVRSCGVVGCMVLGACTVPLPASSWPHTRHHCSRAPVPPTEALVVLVAVRLAPRCCCACRQPQHSLGRLQDCRSNNNTEPRVWLKPAPSAPAHRYCCAQQPSNIGWLFALCVC
jgi:hypothetical protein